MGYLRNPPLSPDTFKRLIETWAASELNYIMEFTAPSRYGPELVSYCEAAGLGLHVNMARTNKCSRFTVRKLIASGHSDW